jgi:hypothetical protein
LSQSSSVLTSLLLYELLLMSIDVDCFFPVYFVCVCVCVCCYVIHAEETREHLRVLELIVKCHHRSG